jgi:predicted nucleic acid-binding protein
LTKFKQINEETEWAISCLTLFELKRLALRGSLDQWLVDSLIETIKSLCLISWLDTVEVHDAAAGLAHGLGIPAVDALLLAGLPAIGAEIIYTTDAHLEKYNKKGVRVVRL